MLHPARPWGLVTELSQSYGVSRKFLYEVRNKAVEGMMTSLLAQTPGRPTNDVARALNIDKSLVDQSIVTLVTAVPGSIRGIQVSLQAILGVSRSVGYISETLQQAADKAAAQNVLEVPIKAVLAEADEIFQASQPCLTVVDGRSFMVVHLSPESQRDATTWGVRLLEAQQRGVVFADIACDGARGIRAGVEQAQLKIPLRPDLFHLLREGHVVLRHLETVGYGSIEQADKVRRAVYESQLAVRRRGRPLKVTLSLAEAEYHECQAMECYDSFSWLVSQLRQALEPWQRVSGSEWQLTCSKASRHTIEAALALMKLHWL